MSRAACLPLLVLIAACGDGSAQPSATAEATNMPVASSATNASVSAIAAAAPAAQSSPADWTGEYRRDGVTISIKPASQPKQYDISILNEIGGGGFGVGSIKGGALTATFAVGNTADGWKECRFTFTRAPEGLKLTGDRNCRGFLSDGAVIDGLYRQSGSSPGASTTKISRAALIGVWVEGDGCATDTGLAVHDDGTWSQNGHEGHWRLEGKTFVKVTTASPSDDAMAPPEPITLATPFAEHWIIKDVGENSISFDDEGQELRMIDCS